MHKKRMSPLGDSFFNNRVSGGTRLYNYLLPNFSLPLVGKTPVSPNCSSMRIN